MGDLDTTLPQGDDLTGSTLDNYTILEVVGRGGMGVVYRGRDNGLQRDVAIKMMDTRLLARDQHRKRFEVEARALAMLKHRNIVDVYALRQTEFGLMIVMELVSGRSLHSFLREHAPLTIDRSVEIFVQVLSGLRHAHRAGIVHRDIKPANILLNDQGELKITDFGLAKLRDVTALTQAGSTMGSPAYMSPEQVRGEDVDNRSDIWSAGVLLHEMLLGSPPFSATEIPALHYQILNTRLRSARQLRPDIPKWLDDLIGRCIAKDREKRPKDCDEILNEISERTGRPTVKRANGPAPAQTPRRWNRSILVASTIAGLITLTALVVAAWSLFVPVDDPPQVPGAAGSTGSGGGDTTITAMPGPSDSTRITATHLATGPGAETDIGPRRLPSPFAFAAYVADQLARTAATSSGSALVIPFIYEDTGFGDQYSLYLKEVLESKLAAAGRWTIHDAPDRQSLASRPAGASSKDPSHGFYLKGSYWMMGDSVHIMAAAVSVGERQVLTTMDALLPAKDIRSKHLKQKDLTLILGERKLYGGGRTTPQGPAAPQGAFHLELWTNKGTEGLIFFEGDTIEVHVRAPSPCNIRLVYHMADGRRILPTGQESHRLDAGGETPLELVWRFECSEPFGAEFLHAFASTSPFERAEANNEDGYWVLQGETEQFVSLTRGMKQLDRNVTRAEASLMFTTLQRGTVPENAEPGRGQNTR